MVDTKHEFANAYITIYRGTVKEYEEIPKWQFIKRKKLQRKLKWCQYHYKKLTGKTIN
jgi:hypothetical protein